MKFKVFKLKFKTPYHLNPGKDSLDKTEKNIQSDMMISAISVAHKKLYGDFPEEFFDPSKVIISSLFPYYKDKLFFPSPLFTFLERDDNEKERKRFKKVRYVEKSIWEKIISGEKVKQDKSLLFGELYGIKVNEENQNAFFIIEEVQRLGNNPFFFSQVRIIDEGGVFFIAKVTDEEDVFKRFTASLRFLGDDGFGGDKTVGKGLFEVESIEDIKINHPEKSNFWLSLSFYIPSNEDFPSIDFDKSYYRLQHKKGWYVSYKYLSLRKRSIYGFSEGSIFHSSQMLKGKVVELLKKGEIEVEGVGKNEFSVWRNGSFFGFPVKIGGMDG